MPRLPSDMASMCFLSQIPLANKEHILEGVVLGISGWQESQRSLGIPCGFRLIPLRTLETLDNVKCQLIKLAPLWVRSDLILLHIELT